MSIGNNTTNNSFDHIDDSTTWLLKLSFWPIRIVCPLLIIFCPIANWICISVFQSRIYNRSSSKWYFIFIAIFDTIYVLVTAPVIFLLTLEVYILNWNVFCCKTIIFLNYLSCQVSASLLACLSIDRLIATSFSFIYRYNCTANISKYVCLSVIFLLSIINSHYFIGYTIDSHGLCSIRYYKWYEGIYKHLNVVYLLSYSIIPFTTIAICNLFIVISVCQNKSNIKKKYLSKKTKSSPTTNQNERMSMNLSPICLLTPIDKTQNVEQTKLDMFISIDDNQEKNKIAYSKFEWPPNHKLSLDNEEIIPPNESLKIQKSRFSFHDRSYSSRLSSSLPIYSQKICVQLQITISLLAISISFIFCTLPNCISTIMIETYNSDAKIREFWQAMNYFSIIPLLITHSVNLLFYCLSSNTFRNRFKESYLKKIDFKQKFSITKFL